MKILMVCLGNICRSPLAHGVMENLVLQKKLNWIIDSAGTGNWHIGQAPDKRSIAIAQKYSIDISDQRCRQFVLEDFDNFDHILVMDYSNLNDVTSMARNDADHHKISLFLENAIVPDPYHDDDQFDQVFQMIEKRCNELLDQYTSII